MSAGPKVHALDLAELDESPTNPRRVFDERELADLAASISEHGLLQPILVRQKPDGRYEVVAGARRYRASRIAGRKYIAAIVVELSDTEALELQVIENSQRVDVSAADEALAFSRLLELGYTSSKIARKIGRDARYVRRRLDLLRLPEWVRDRVGTSISFDAIGRVLALPESAAREVINEVEREVLADYELESIDEAFGDPDALLALCELLALRVQTHNRLARARFDPGRAGLAGATACTNCKYNTTQQSHLFEFGADDARCLNSECWDRKTLAHDALEQSRLEASGARLLPPETAVARRVQLYGGVHREYSVDDVPADQRGWLHDQHLGWVEVVPRDAFEAHLRATEAPPVVIQAAASGVTFVQLPKKDMEGSRKGRYERVEQGFGELMQRFRTCSEADAERAALAAGKIVLAWRESAAQRACERRGWPQIEGESWRESAVAGLCSWREASSAPRSQELVALLMELALEPVFQAWDVSSVTQLIDEFVAVLDPSKEVDLG